MFRTLSPTTTFHKYGQSMQASITRGFLFGVLVPRMMVKGLGFRV